MNNVEEIGYIREKYGNNNLKFTKLKVLHFVCYFEFLV
jgi:hypothetical protein